MYSCASRFGKASCSHTHGTSNFISYDILRQQNRDDSRVNFGEWLLSRLKTGLVDVQSRHIVTGRANVQFERVVQWIHWLGEPLPRILIVVSSAEIRVISAGRDTVNIAAKQVLAAESSTSGPKCGC